jgi:hypothetical protein
MKQFLPTFEHRSQALLPPGRFAIRVIGSAALAAVLIGISLVLGIVGYHIFESLNWIDSFLNASMLLGGMGPVDMPKTNMGKLFSGLYALYSGLVVILVAGIILAPIAHRVLHRFHLEAASEGQD